MIGEEAEEDLQEGKTKLDRWETWMEEEKEHIAGALLVFTLGPVHATWNTY